MMQKQDIATFGIRAPDSAILMWRLDGDQRFKERRRGAIQLSPIATSGLRHTGQGRMALLQLSRTWSLLNKRFLPETRGTLFEP